MKTMTKIGALLLSSTLLFSACQRSGGCGCDIEDPYAKGKGDLRVISNITKPGTRVAGETWEISDAIGIFAVNSGQALGASNYASNAKYTTATTGARVNFTSATQGINVPSTGSLDLIAYYPYAAGITDELSFNTADQSNHALIDVLYSDNQKNITQQNRTANLVFNHMLTLVEFDITTDGQVAIHNGKVTLNQVLVDGKMALADGTVTTGTTTAAPSVSVKSAGTNKYKAMMILPPQDLNGKEVTFDFDGQTHRANLKLQLTESGYKYLVKVTYSQGQVVIIEGASINPWKDGGENGEVIVIGGGTVTPTPPVPGVASVIYSEDFSADLGQMTAKDVKGAQSWRANTRYKNANMTGFANNASHENEDWLVSPAFDLTSATSLAISFKHTINKGDVAKMKDEQTLWVSDNYSGDVTTATWTQVEIPTYPTGSDWTYVESGKIELPQAMLGKSNVVFAFKYLSTDASSANWQIQDLKVESAGGKLVGGGTTPQPPTPPTPPTPPAPAQSGLLFPGSNFDDWAAFTGNLNQYGLKNYATQVDGGKTGKAMLIKGTPTGNDYVFTVQAPSGAPTQGSKITFYIKGTAGKSLSINVYADGGYKPFNLGIVSGTSDVTVNSAGNNQYTGTIDTQGAWVKVTLNIAGLNLNSSGNYFALKVGKDAAFDLMVDDFTIE